MLRRLIARYEENLLDSVLPFWLRHSLDRDYGGYFTCLDREGGVYDTRKYVWLHGRAAWTFSKLYNEVEPRPEWLDAARLILEFTRRHAFDPQGRCYFSLTREGRPSFYQRKPYAAVFVALGLIEYSKTGAPGPFLEEAIDLFWRIRDWIAHPALLGRPVYHPGARVSQLADIMVVALLALELAKIDPDPRYREILAECLDAALRHYFPPRRTLLETISSDGRFLLDSPEGRLVSPGSALEVAWFLLDLLDWRPDPAKEARVFEIIEGSLDYGWDKEYGGLYYFMDVEDRPTLQLEANMKLWWPHTEALYALIRAWLRTGEARWLRWLELVDEYAFRVFADPRHGEWFGYADRAGNLTHTLKGNNYKGCFHVPRFLLLSLQALKRHAPPQA